MNAAAGPCTIAALIACVAVAAAEPATLEHRTEVDIDPAAGQVSVVDRITVTGRARLTLDLRPGFAFDAVGIDGIDLDPPADPTRLDLPLPDRGRHEVTLRYAGRPAPGTDGAFVDARGAFLPASGGWLPGWREALHSYRLTVTVPAPFRAVATGATIDERSVDGRHTVIVAADRSLEGPSVFAGAFEVAEALHAGTRIRTYFPSAAARLAPLYLDHAAGYIETLSTRIGPYPHAAFSVVAGPLPVGLGYPGLTYVSERILPLPFMQTRSLAHEIAHCWWGNGVGVDYAGGNWAEGLTTFVADYALAAAAGPDAARDMRLAWLRDYAALPAGEDIPIERFVSKTHDARQVIGYGKVAFVFHMLERELGPEIFAAGLRRFWTEHRAARAGWPDIEATFTAVAGRDLGRFFEQWIARAGAPALGLAGARAERTATGHRLHVAITQSAPHYRLAVPLQVDTDAEPRSLVLAIDGPRVEATFDLDARPLRLVVDGGYDLFRHLAPGEATPIFRDVTLAPDAGIEMAVGDDPVARQSAAALGARLLPRRRTDAPEPATDGGAGPVLLIALDAHLPAALTRHGLGTEPPTLAGRGSARAFAARRTGGATVMVVSARDAASLASLMRPLPHYRKYGYVVFEGSKALERGVWASTDSGLSADLR